MVESEYLPVKRPSRNSSSHKERKLAESLRRYTTENSVSYDVEFTAEILALQPHWLARRIKSAPIKRKLLEMAKSGARKPLNLSHPSGPSEVLERKLAGALCCYIHKNSSSYDPEFDRQIREIRPEWAAKPNLTAVKKQKILEMAKNGDKKPNEKSEEHLNRVLSRSINKNSSCYDLEFDIEVHKLRHDWFENSVTTIVKKQMVAAKKQKLLEMARNGEGRPTNFNHPSSPLEISESRLAIALKNYTRSGHARTSYDPEFDAEIRTLRPDWFETFIRKPDGSMFRTSSALKKQKLLEMARKGEERPSCKLTNLGTAIARYTNSNKTQYDPEFDAEIRTLRPDWFEKTALKKQRLLEMAKSGVKKPSRSGDIAEKRLLWALASYTSKSSECYDLDFDVEIRALSPEWFNRQLQKA
jgi:hypothetical protein